MSAPAERPHIDVHLVRRLISTQFPQWAGLPITKLAAGHDNRSFRLGQTMLVRLPGAAPYAAQAEKEQRWLPQLAPRLPLPIPAPLAIGQPGEDYPWRWQVLGWIEGDTAAAARAMARLRTAIRRIASSGESTPAMAPADSSPTL